MFTKNYEHGVLGMIESNSLIKGLKSAWIKKLIKDDISKWKTLLENNN